jgi:hypothetical protein
MRAPVDLQQGTVARVPLTDPAVSAVTVAFR